MAADYARAGREVAWEPGKVMCGLRRKIAENGPEALGDEPAVVADLARDEPRLTAFAVGRGMREAHSVDG